MAVTTRIERSLASVAVVLLVVFSALCVTLFVDPHMRHLKDSAIYILAAKSLAAGDGYAYQGLPFFSRPPGLSYLLAPFAGGSIDHALLNRGVQLLAVLGFGAVAGAFARLHGWRSAMLVALLYAINPVTVGSFNTVMAEFPFMLLFFGALWLLTPSRDGEPRGWGRALVGIVLMAAAQQFRSVAMLAVAALVLVETLRPGGRRGRTLVLAAMFGLLCLPWMLHASRVAAEAPRPSTQLLVFDYATALLKVDSRDPDSAFVDLDGWVERAADNGEALVSTLSEAFVGVSEGPLVTLVAVLLGAAVAFAWWRRRSVMDWTLLAYLALLLVYFTFAERLLLPLIPLLLSSLIFSLERLGEFSARRSIRPDLARLPLAVVTGALLAGSLVQLPAALQLDEKESVWQQVDLASASWLIDNTSDDTIVLTERAAIMELLSGRSTYTFRNLPGPWPKGCPDVDLALIGPRSLRIEKRWQAAALESTTFEVPWYADQGGSGMVRSYRLR